MNRKLLAPIAIGVIVLLLAGYGLYTRLYNPSNTLPTPPGYKASSTGNEYIPVEAPEMIETSVNASGFSEDTLTLTLPKNNVPIVFHLKNDGDTALNIRLFRTPDGEWPDDPPRIIDPQQFIPFYLDKKGEYIFQNAQNTNQHMNIIVK